MVHRLTWYVNIRCIYPLKLRKFPWAKKETSVFLMLMIFTKSTRFLSVGLFMSPCSYMPTLPVTKPWNCRWITSSIILGHIICLYHNRTFRQFIIIFEYTFYKIKSNYKSIYMSYRNKQLHQIALHNSVLSKWISKLQTIITCICPH